MTERHQPSNGEARYHQRHRKLFTSPEAQQQFAERMATAMDAAAEGLRTCAEELRSNSDVALEKVFSPTITGMMPASTEVAVTVFDVPSKAKSAPNVAVTARRRMGNDPSSEAAIRLLVTPTGVRTMSDSAVGLG